MYYNISHPAVYTCIKSLYTDFLNTHRHQTEYFWYKLRDLEEKNAYRKCWRDTGNEFNISDNYTKWEGRQDKSLKIESVKNVIFDKLGYLDC